VVEARIVLTALALLAAIVISGILGWRRYYGAVLLALLSFVWLSADSEWELGLLFKIDPQHGVVTSDLVSLVGFCLALCELVRLRLRPPRGGSHRESAPSRAFDIG
jgi:hypothetical protein